MARPASFAVAFGAVLLAIGMAPPLAAQPAGPGPRMVDLPGYGPVYIYPVPPADTLSQPQIVNVPGYGNVYVVPVRPNDTRTQRQRCIDEETASAGGSPSTLAKRVIDLKCSQR